MTRENCGRKSNIFFTSLIIETILLTVALVMIFFNIKGYFAPALTSIFSIICSIYYYFYVGNVSAVCIDDNEKDIIKDEYLQKHVEKIFRKKGYRLDNCTYNGITNDIVMYKKKEKIVLNIYKTKEKINISSIQNLVISMWNYDANKGYLIANSEFDKDILNMNCSCDVELWDKDKLMKNIK